MQEKDALRQSSHGVFVVVVVLCFFGFFVCFKLSDREWKKEEREGKIQASEDRNGRREERQRGGGGVSER